MIDEIGNGICMAEQTAGRNGVAEEAPPAAFPLRCKRQTGQHILMTELGEVFQKFRLTGASGQALQDVPHGQSCSPHTGLAEPNSRIDGDVLKPRGAFTGCSMPMARPIAVAVPGRPRGPERCHD